MPRNGPRASEDYRSLPDGVRAELIDGGLWDPASPSRAHQRVVFSLARKLAEHIDARHGARGLYPAPLAVNLFADDTTFVEPDVSAACDHVLQAA